MSTQTEQVTHTPGPWRITEPNGFGTIHVRSNDEGPTPVPIAEVLHFGPEGAEANALLIHAAPELLEAAMDAASTLDVVIETWLGQDVPEGVTASAAKLRAAIAAATTYPRGEES